MSGGYQTREHERYALHAPVQVSWTDRDGKKQQVVGTSLDVSIYGMLVELPGAIRVQTEVTVTIGGAPIQAAAKVRRCAEIFSWFRVGIEFERTLLAEDIPLLNETLIKSLRSAHEQPRPKCLEFKPAKILRRLAKAVCFLTGHQYGWGSLSSDDGTLCCKRCGAIAEDGPEIKSAGVLLH